MKEAVNIFWFRRDLRLHDNAGLYHALKEGQQVIPIFIFDREILDKLEDKKDRRVEFIRETLIGMQTELLQEVLQREIPLFPTMMTLLCLMPMAIP